MNNLPYPYMPRPTNARIAGFAFLLYIAVSLFSLFLFNEATGADGTAAKLAYIAEHATDVRISVVLGLLTPFVVIVLSTALYAITRNQDRFISMVAMTCLFGGAAIEGSYIPTTLGLLALATSAGGNVTDTSAVSALGTFLLTARAWTPLIGATFFGVGSALYAWLLLGGRVIPVSLAWLGVFASVLWIVGIALHLVGVLPDPVARLVYVPMFVFEILVGLWLLVKGVEMPSAHTVSTRHADPAL